MAAYIQTAMDQGDLASLDSALAAEQLMELCVGGGYRLRLQNVAPEPDTAEIQAKVETALRTFMQVYGPARPAGIAA